jgi:hypothetical protein
MIGRFGQRSRIFVDLTTLQGAASFGYRSFQLHRHGLRRQ